MQVPKIKNDNMSFQAGNVILKEIEPKNLIQFDKIKEIAEKDKLDLSIKKGINSKYLPTSDLYVVIATKEINKNPYILHANSCAIVGKHAEMKDISEKIYDAVIRSVENLAKNIKKHTGTKPEFLKYLKK